MASILDDIRDMGSPKYKYKYFLENISFIPRKKKRKQNRLSKDGAFLQPCGQE